MKQIIINSKDLNQIKDEIRKGGANQLHVLADFDRTLTQAFVGGEKTPSIISELRSKNYISEVYSRKAHKLFEKYHPIEIDLNIPKKEKNEKMYEWWKKHFELLIKSGLNKTHLEKIIENGKIQFRRGTGEFFDFLHEKNIPLVIISSAGLGKESISMFLERQKRLYDNIYIISNEYEWDKRGNAVAVKEPIIHCMNKSEVSVKKLPIYKDLKKRKNVLLLGDNLEDVGMVEGFDYNNLIKIGFLNENIGENLEQYKKNFDVLILYDGTFGYVNKLLKKIVGK